MQYTAYYHSPLGDILLAADEQGLIGSWFTDQKYYARTLETDAAPHSTMILEQTFRWLDQYFKGEQPNFMPPLHLMGTDFQKAVWEILRRIPYGKITTYGNIAARIAAARGKQSMSAQAVGSAVGHNPISILVPCHRVIGADGKLTGYAGGIHRKKALLELENSFPRTDSLF